MSLFSRMIGGPSDPEVSGFDIAKAIDDIRRSHRCGYCQDAFCQTCIHTMTNTNLGKEIYIALAEELGKNKDNV